MMRKGRALIMTVGTGDVDRVEETLFTTVAEVHCDRSLGQGGAAAVSGDRRVRLGASRPDQRRRGGRRAVAGRRRERRGRRLRPLRPRAGDGPGRLRAPGRGRRLHSRDQGDERRAGPGGHPPRSAASALHHGPARPARHGRARLGAGPRDSGDRRGRPPPAGSGARAHAARRFRRRGDRVARS